MIVTYKKANSPPEKEPIGCLMCIVPAIINGKNAFLLFISHPFCGSFTDCCSSKGLRLTQVCIVTVIVIDFTIYTQIY